MKSNNKRAFTLAEIMVVLLVLTIIFAAFAPIFTKRKLATSSSKYNVWEYYDRVSYDAFYDPGDSDFNGEAFIGVSPGAKDDISTTFLPLSKLVIRSSDNVTSAGVKQRQIMFRYGRSSTTDKGVFGGTWFMDGKNTLMGGTYHQLVLDSSNGAKNNTAIGYDSLSNLYKGQNNTAIGYQALKQASGTAKSNTAIGYQAGANSSGDGNTMIGYFAGGTSANTTGKENTFIGYNTGSAASSNNTFIGTGAGSKNMTSKNTAIGTKALGSLTSGSYNIAIGYNALGSLTGGSNNTAIGYNACSEITRASNKTCIGYNSGPHSGTTSENYLKVLSNGDSEQRTYIGSKPKGYGGGDAVIEIHNVNSSNAGILDRIANTAQGGTNGTKTGNSTTIINGNLIVKGRPYFTVGGTLHHFHDQNFPNKKSNQPYNKMYGYGSQTAYSDTNYYASCTTNADSYNFNSKCVNLYPTTSNLSDRRLKNIGSKFDAGLAELRQIKVFNYTFKNDEKKAPHVGVMAQDLMKVFPNSVYQGADGYLRIKWDEMFYAAINAVKELDKKIVALVKRTTDVETKISKLEQENTSLKTQVASLTARVNKLKAQ